MPPQPAEQQTSPDAFKLEKFGGMLPAWDSHLISEGQADYTQNAYLFSGALNGWRTPKLLYQFKNGASQFAFRLPLETSNIANATLYMQQPSAGDTVTLGEEVYTFVSALSTNPTVAYQVLIGANAAASATNLFNAWTLDSGTSANQGVTYAIGCTANPAIDQSGPPTKNILATDNPRIQVFAPAVGAAYNSTLVASSNAVRLNWTYGGPSTATSTLQGGSNLVFDATITSPSVWLEFADPDTDVMRSPVVDDIYDRFYFASPSVAPTYNTRARIQAGQPAWLLGVPAPGCAPSVSVTGGGNTAQIGFPTSTSTNTGTPGANTIYLIPVTPAGAEILNDIAFLPQSTSSTARFAAVLFSDFNGTPQNLLNTGAIVTGCTAGVAVTSAFVNPTGLLMNVQYWIGIMMDTAVAIQQADNTGSLGVVSLNTFGNGPPAAINSLTTGLPDLKVWGDCTASSVQEARSYVYTYVSAYGEESPPSPATTLTGWSNGTWTIGLFTPPPDQMGTTRNLVGIRIYRTVTSTGGATTYFQVTPVGNIPAIVGATPTGDLPITQASYSDTITDDVVVANTQLYTQLFSPPPEDLQGIVAMPNGMCVGFRANEIWFSQPYYPHAWPASYTLTTEFPIVGLGVSGTSVIACTNGSPYVATGTNPSTMTALKVQNSEPCISRGSILGNNDGVYYAGANGLMLVTQYGAMTNTTEAWITREKWQQLTPQKNLRAVFLVSQYMALGCVRAGDTSVAQRGYTVEINSSDAQSFTIWPQPGGHRIGFGTLTAPNGYNVNNLRIDPWSSVCLVMQNSGVYYYDFSDPAPTVQTYTWRSKLFQQKSKKNFSAMRCWFSIPAGTPAQSAVRNTAPATDPSWNTLGAGQYGIIRVYAGFATSEDSNSTNPPLNLVCCREIRTPQELLRIESGFKTETWQFEITARVPVSNLQVGTSVKALAKT